MLSQRQRNIVVELTLVGRTAQYIADTFDCLISSIRRIRKRCGETGWWQRLPVSGRPKKTTARDKRHLGRLAKRIRFRLLTQVSQKFVTHLGHPVSKRTVQWRLHGQAIYSRVAVHKPNISLGNRLRRRRWCTRMLNWTATDNWSCLLFTDESRFNLAYCDEKVRVSRTAGEKYIPQMSTHGQWKSNRFCNGMGVSG